MHELATEVPQLLNLLSSGFPRWRCAGRAAQAFPAHAGSLLIGASREMLTEADGSCSRAEELIEPGSCKRSPQPVARVAFSRNPLKAPKHTASAPTNTQLQSAFRLQSPYRRERFHGTQTTCARE